MNRPGTQAIPGLAQLAQINLLRRYVHSACSSRGLVPHVGIFWGGLADWQDWAVTRSMLKRPAFLEDKPRTHPVMSNPAVHDIQTYCYSRNDAAIGTHSLPNPGPEVVSQRVGEAVALCPKQLLHGKGV